MPQDRDAALRQAEKLLRQGRLDGAIAEYVRLIEDQPRDWNSINALGDLYVRAGDADRAVEQFTRIADFLFGEGFLPKAAALYKKALKVAPDHDHSLLRLSEIAARQGLLADARVYLRHLGRQRRDRGDARGAAECLVRLALLDEADGEAKLAGARAAQAFGDVPQAIALFVAAADQLSAEGKRADALDALAEAAALDAFNTQLRSQLARECVAAGQLDRARSFLTLESAGSDPDLLLALGRMELASGNAAEARSVLVRFLTVAPQRSRDLLRLADELAAAGRTDAGFSCAEVAVDDALLASDWDRALEGLRSFLRHGQHIPALMKLVELAVDAGRDDVMHQAQEQLADAYLEAGRGAEARVVAEDLVARQPASDAHADRLRRALGLLGVEDPESIVDRSRQAPAKPGDDLDFDFDTPASDDPSEPPPPPAPSLADPPATAPSERVLSRGVGLQADQEMATPAEPRAHDADAIALFSADGQDDAFTVDVLEIDLSEALAGLGTASSAPPPASPAEQPPAAARDLELVFGDIRSQVATEQPALDAAAQYGRALEHLEHGRIADALADLQEAARAPLFRFRAAARLGRLHVGRGDLEAGIDWLERAAEAPAPSQDEALAVLYDLAGALEGLGESARALAVLMEIDTDAAAYRDVHERIEQLTRAQAESRRP